MKKVLLGLVIVLLSGCGEIYLKAGTRHIDEYQESQKTYDRPLTCIVWWSAQCEHSRQVEGS